MDTSIHLQSNKLPLQFISNVPISDAQWETEGVHMEIDSTLKSTEGW